MGKIQEKSRLIKKLIVERDVEEEDESGSGSGSAGNFFTNNSIINNSRT